MVESMSIRIFIGSRCSGVIAFTLFLCCYGFIKEFRPAVPFLTPYLIQSKNFTDVELYSQIYPYWTYGYLLALLPIFLLTDLLRYKPIIVLEAITLVITWALLLWTDRLLMMQLMQVVFGIASASEIAYYSYIYAMVDERHYKRVTSFVRCATLSGKMCAYAFAQVLISAKIGDYRLLNYVSFGCVSIIVAFAIAIPTVAKRKQINWSKSLNDDTIQDSPSSLVNDSVLANVSLRLVDDIQRLDDDKIDDTLETCPLPTTTTAISVSVYFQWILTNFIQLHRNADLLKWSLWWAMASCGMFQIWNYVQTLWAELQIGHDTSAIQNGITEFIATFLGALVTFLMQYVNVNWRIYGELVLAIIALIDAILLFIMARTNQLILAYAIYILLCCLYHMLITAASHNIASRLVDSSSCGMVFAWNTFIALCMQSCLTFAVADSHGFALSIRNQFIVYAAFHLSISIVFAVMMLVGYVRTRRNKIDE